LVSSSVAAKAKDWQVRVLGFRREIRFFVGGEPLGRWAVTKDDQFRRAKKTTQKSSEAVVPLPTVRRQNLVA